MVVELSLLRFGSWLGKKDLFVCCMACGTSWSMNTPRWATCFKMGCRRVFKFGPWNHWQDWWSVEVQQKTGHVDMLFPKQCCSMLDFKSGLKPTSTMTPKLILLDLQITTWAAEQTPSKDSATARRIDCAESAFEGKAWEKHVKFECGKMDEIYWNLVFVLLGHSCVSARTYDLVNLENTKMWHLTWLGVKLTRHYSWEVLLISKTGVWLFGEMESMEAEYMEDRGHNFTWA